MAIFFMRRKDSLSEILTEGDLTALELFLLVLLKVRFRQIRLQSPLQLLDLGNTPENIYSYMFRRKQPLPSVHSTGTSNL